MSSPDAKPPKPVERLFPFALRARLLLVGRETLSRSRRKLHFVLITTDLSENSRKEILRDFQEYPVVERFTSADLARFFNLHAAKVIGFAKSTLSQSIYSELKAHAIHIPERKPRKTAAPPHASDAPGPAGE